MGRVAGSYGVRGWLKVVPSGGGAEPLTRAGKWWIGEIAYRVEEARIHGATVVARLAGLETREHALALKGATVAVERSALPEPEAGHYYLGDLVGMRVVNERDEWLGVVERMFSNGAQDVMEVAREGGRQLLPWVPAVVKEVDLAKRRIVVDWEADW